ncbi:MAG: hypothetical protein GX107_06185 [Clostridiales bacterium]|jgi:hypothetical protein|nr:hypothetical protein [Clostridiales bacterium]
MMIKGVNRQVVEITQTDCEYFERILYFVKPEYASVSEGKLRDRAGMMSASGSPPPSKLRKSRWIMALKLGAAALAGALLSGLAFAMF